MTATNDTERRETQDDVHSAPTLSGRSATPETVESDRARFRLTWRDGAYYVSRAEIGNIDVVSYELARKLEAQRDSLMAALKEISRILDHGGQAKDLRDIARAAIASVKGAA